MAWIGKAGAKGREIGVDYDEQVELLVGSKCHVIVNKLYGPLIFEDIRITTDIETCQWVISRWHHRDQKWEEVARVEGQDDTKDTDLEEVDHG